MSDPIREDWDLRFLEMAAFVGRWSRDRSAGTGCCIVDDDRIVRSIGYNGLPRGVDDGIPGRHERPLKYEWTEHAERNAIYNASRLGVPLVGATAYLNWFPCAECARALVQVGIRRLVALSGDANDAHWGTGFSVAKEMMTEAGMQVVVRDLPQLAARTSREPRTGEDLLPPRPEADPLLPPG